MKSSSPRPLDIAKLITVIALSALVVYTLRIGYQEAGLLGTEDSGVFGLPFFSLFYIILISVQIFSKRVSAQTLALLLFPYAVEIIILLAKGTPLRESIVALGFIGAFSGIVAFIIFQLSAVFAKHPKTKKREWKQVAIRFVLYGFLALAFFVEFTILWDTLYPMYVNAIGTAENGAVVLGITVISILFGAYSLGKSLKKA